KPGRWSGRGARDGVLSVRFTRGREVRRITLVRRGGRFRVVAGTEHLLTGDLELAVREELLTFLDELDRTA
ncbi:MAG: hypothetical protein ACLGH5_06845, partial [Actinomycetes bacterium]